MKIAGLDIGTTGCKCTVFDENGKYLGKAYRDYPVRRKVTGHEIDVSTIMDGVLEAIGEMAESLRAEGLNARQFLFRRNGDGTNGHPRIPEQQEMADELAPFLAALLNWREDTEP